MNIFNISPYFIACCTFLTALTTISLIMGIFSVRSHSFRFYRFYLLVYVINNFMDSIVYQFTLVYSIVTRNTFILMATGLFSGPRAVGAHLIVNAQTFTLIIFLLNFRFARLCSPSIHEILCHRASILLHSFWIGLNALLVYSIPALFFLPDADSIDQIQPLLNNMLEVPRDTGYSMTTGTYWAVDTFVELKPKPIVGLSIFLFTTFMNTVWAIFYTYKIMRATKFSHSPKRYTQEKQHLLSLWIQLFIAIFPLVICRLAWALVPIFSRVRYYNLLNFSMGYSTLYGIPLRPLGANIALLLTVKEIRVGCHYLCGRSEPRIGPQSTESTHD